MTNIQAINLLKGLWQSLDDYCELNDEGKAAFCMAIEALSCSEIPNSSDTISREAAVDALDKRFDSIPMEQTTEILLLRKDLRELPSVQPEKRTEERTETHACDLIDRQAAIDALKNDMASLDHIIRGMSANDVRLDAYVSQRNQVNYDIDTINNIPAAQPEELDTLIKALEAEHKKLREMQKALKNVPDTNVGDTISRQAALDIFDDYNVAVENGQIEAYSRDRKRLCDLPPVTPKQRTGKWILDRSGAYCCSECMEPCAGYVMMKPRDKFCKMCGAKMEV